MSYEKDLLKKIKNADWPQFDRPDFLNELDSLAEEMHAKKSTEGYLASLLVYQQLVEEMIKLLVRYSNLLIQCSIFPQEIKFKEPDRLMFGKMIDLLEAGLLNDDIRKLIETARTFSDLRNRLVHRITIKTTIADIRKQAQQAKKYYDKIYNLYDKITDEYLITLKDFHKSYEDFAEVIAATPKQKTKRKIK